MGDKTTIIAITNQKGGVGKTTTAINLAYYLAKSKKSVLLIDFDPQGNASSGLGISKQNLGATMAEVISREISLNQAILPTKYSNLFVAPTTPRLANTEVELANAKQRFTRLLKAVQSLRQVYDYILIDCPPSLSLLTVNALIVARYIILPVQTEFYALEGLGQLLETMKIIRSAMNPNLEILGVLPTMVDRRTVLSGQVIEEIKKHFQTKVFENTIPRNIRLAEAPSHGLAIGDYDRFSQGARAYKKLTKEVLERVESEK